MDDYTILDAAALLNMTPGGVRTNIRRGRIVATKRGRDWFIPQSEIDRYNQARRDGLIKVGRPARIAVSTIIALPTDATPDDVNRAREQIRASFNH